MFKKILKKCLDTNFEQNLKIFEKIVNNLDAIMRKNSLNVDGTQKIAKF